MTKKKNEEIKVETCQITLQSQSVRWEGAFPYTQEVYKNEDGVSIVAGRYYILESKELTDFLFQLVRKGNLPIWIKNNFQNIKKLIKNEIKHRKKMGEKLSQEQKWTIAGFFKDENFFDYDENSEFAQLEEEVACVDFFKHTLTTKFYESFVKQGLKKRKEVLGKYGRF